MLFFLKFRRFMTANFNMKKLKKRPVFPCERERVFLNVNKVMKIGVIIAAFVLCFIWVMIDGD